MIYSLADEGVTVFVTTHYMEEAEYCNRIALIDRGRLIALGTPLELKRDRLKGHISEVETPDVLGAVDALLKKRESGEVRDAAVFGRNLHVRLAENVDAETFLKEVLTSEGIAVEKIRRIEPTLEDVFVALVGKGLDDESGKGANA